MTSGPPNINLNSKIFFSNLASTFEASKRNVDENNTQRHETGLSDNSDQSETETYMSLVNRL